MQYQVNASHTAPQSIVLFGDKRDEVLKSLYSLFAAYGHNPIKSNPSYNSYFGRQNMFFRFKYLTYMPKFHRLNKDGLVLLELFSSATSLSTTLSNINNALLPTLAASLGTAYTYTLKVEEIVKVEENCTHVVVYAQMAYANSIVHIVPAFMTVQIIRSSKNLRQDILTNAMPMADLEADAEEAYRKQIPSNLQPHEWEQAFLNNPDPTKYVPKLICGFYELGYHYRLTKTRSKKVYDRLQNVAGTLENMKVSVNIITTKLRNIQRRMSELSTKMLQVSACKIMVDRHNQPLSDMEIVLKSLIEPSISKIAMLAKIQTEVGDALKYKSNFSFTMNGQRIASTLEPEVEELLLQFLQNQQHRIKGLMKDIKVDAEMMNELERIDDVKYPWEG